MSSKPSPSHHVVYLYGHVEDVLILTVHFEGSNTVKTKFLGERERVVRTVVMEVTWSFSAACWSWRTLPWLSLARVVTISLWSQSSPSSGLGCPAFHLFSVSFLL